MIKAAGFNEVPQDTKGFLELCKALRRRARRSGFALGRAPVTAMPSPTGCCWSHGAAQVDENEKITISSPETRAALRYAKELWDTFIPGTAAWNDANNNRAFLSGEISLTANGISHLCRRRTASQRCQAARDRGRHGPRLLADRPDRQARPRSSWPSRCSA